MAVHDPGSRPLPGTRLVGNFICLVNREGKKFCGLKATQSMVFLLKQPKLRQTPVTNLMHVRTPGPIALRYMAAKSAAATVPARDSTPGSVTGQALP